MSKWAHRPRTANLRRNKFAPNLEVLEDCLVPTTFTVHNAAQLAAAITAADHAPGSTINLAAGTSAITC